MRMCNFQQSAVSLRDFFKPCVRSFPYSLGFFSSKDVTENFLEFKPLLCFYRRILFPWRLICSPTVHCKDTIQKILNKYSQERNCAATVPVPTFMFLWAIYIFLWSVCLFCCRKIGAGRTWEYIARSQTHECGNWDWGRAIPFRVCRPHRNGRCKD